LRVKRRGERLARGVLRAFRLPIGLEAVARSATRRRVPATGVRRHETMLAVLVQFRDVVRAMRNHYRLVERATGISGACVWAMSELESAPGLRISELAAQLAIHQSTASNLVERLAAAGLVERRADADRRIAHIYLTRRGCLALQRALAPQRGVLLEGLARVPSLALARLHDDLGTLLV